MRAAFEQIAVAGPLKERRGHYGVLLDAFAAVIQSPKTVAAVHGAAVTRLSIQSDSERRVLVDAGAIVVHEAEGRAACGYALVACLFEQSCSTALILQDLLTLEQAVCEAAAGIGIAGPTGVLQPPGLLSAGVAAGASAGEQGKHHYNACRLA